jgi:hypothetical protein
MPRRCTKLQGKGQDKLSDPSDWRRGFARHSRVETEAAWVRGRQNFLLRWTANIGYRSEKTAAHPYHR